jgi:hypothetical protein
MSDFQTWREDYLAFLQSCLAKARADVQKHTEAMKNYEENGIDASAFMPLRAIASKQIQVLEDVIYTVTLDNGSKK